MKKVFWLLALGALASAAMAASLGRAEDRADQQAGQAH
ncbi:hypothetical protein L288_05240 [Sphingobium quisquiliarum P25]|uniref:Uncharacterized protein n=1 Tax=Sphingobium quisquiliarum P25 TaxID=1329909 RepID=T0IDV3_9SPHN|nr:hypothetical protein L288_05240 [Sphingobium quisquiliarum P25]EZP73303.1 hypothetical protein BV96_00742 [Sphingomonas paucimobilis]